MTANQSAHADGQAPPLIVVPPPGPVSRSIAARLSAVECPAFDARRNAREKSCGADQAPIAYARGQGANVFDADGNRYVDLVAGFGALSLGHAHPELLLATAKQAGTLGLALGDVYASEVKASLLEQLAALYPAPGARVLLGLSGADAVTAALKTALLATGKPGVVAFRGGYHGLSHGPLAACGLSEGFRAPFAEHLGIPVAFAPYPATPDMLPAALAAVSAALAQSRVGAVLVEPLLGRGGCVEAPPGFLVELTRLAKAASALVIADEVWTGMGRSGAWAASFEQGAVPDLLCFGKALGGGTPISACVGSAEAMAAWGAHGGNALQTATHFGSPIACAAALATLSVLRRDGLLARSARLGAQLRDELRQATAGRGVRAITGKGLMVGVHIEGGPGRALAATRALLARGYITLTGGTASEALTLSPPLTIAEELLRGFAACLGDVLGELA